MKIYISVDIEGCAGVVDREQGNLAGGAEYALGRRLMTEETNAAIEGLTGTPPAHARVSTMA